MPGTPPMFLANLQTKHRFGTPEKLFCSTNPHSMQDPAYSSPSKRYPAPPLVLRIASKHAGLRHYECAQCETSLRFQSLTGKILMSKDLGPRVRSIAGPTESFGCTMISGFWSWRKVRCHTPGAIGCGKVADACVTTDGLSIFSVPDAPRDSEVPFHLEVLFPPSVE